MPGSARNMCYTWGVKRCSQTTYGFNHLDWNWKRLDLTYFLIKARSMSSVAYKVHHSLLLDYPFQSRFGLGRVFFVNSLRWNMDPDLIQTWVESCYADRTGGTHKLRNIARSKTDSRPHLSTFRISANSWVKRTLYNDSFSSPLICSGSSERYH